MALKEKDKALDFTLPDQEHQAVTLSDFKGKWVLLYFYPKDNTPGCTQEGCALQEQFPQFTKNTVVIFGISADSVESHKKFAEKFQFQFRLLADTEKTIVKAYGVWGKKKFMGREYLGISRMSFLIDPKGKIAKIYNKVKPKEHAQEVLHDVKDLSQSA